MTSFGLGPAVAKNHSGVQTVALTSWRDGLPAKLSWCWMGSARKTKHWCPQALDIQTGHSGAGQHTEGQGTFGSWPGHKHPLRHKDIVSGPSTLHKIPQKARKHSWEVILAPWDCSQQSGNDWKVSLSPNSCHSNVNIQNMEAYCLLSQLICKADVSFRELFMLKITLQSKQ